MKKLTLISIALAAFASFSCNKEKPYVPDEPTVVPRTLEDFEDEGMLIWEGKKGAAYELVANPATTGINTSEKCGKVTLGENVEGYIYCKPIANDPKDFFNFSKNGYRVKVQIMGPKAGAKIYLKLERGGTADQNVHPMQIVTKATTKSNEWEEIVFDFENDPVDDPEAKPEDELYKKMCITFDAGGEGHSGAIWYVDNIIQFPSPEQEQQ